jgi:hypothetical protein
MEDTTYFVEKQQWCPVGGLREFCMTSRGYEIIYSKRPAELEKNVSDLKSYVPKRIRLDAS